MLWDGQRALMNFGKSKYKRYSYSGRKWDNNSTEAEYFCSNFIPIYAFWF